LIFERTGKVAKTHRGVHSEFARLAKDDPNIDKSFPVYSHTSLQSESCCRLRNRPGSIVPPQRAALAIETAGRFIDCISKILAPNVS
jgi:hypothetical protein